MSSVMPSYSHKTGIPYVKYLFYHTKKAKLYSPNLKLPIKTNQKRPNNLWANTQAIFANTNYKWFMYVGLVYPLTWMKMWVVRFGLTYVCEIVQTDQTRYGKVVRYIFGWKARKVVFFAAWCADKFYIYCEIMECILEPDRVLFLCENAKTNLCVYLHVNDAQNKRNKPTVFVPPILRTKRAYNTSTSSPYISQTIAAVCTG